MKIQEIPVLLLTGYLGSGKTTLVNKILTNRKGIRFAVIVNDIGEVNIDAELIQKGGVVNTQDDSLVALQNGCICCSLKMDLVKQLHDIAVTDQFDYIVIEASGICEPAPIAQTICSIPEVAPAYALDGLPRLDCIVSVVDALRLKDEFRCGLDLTKSDEEDIANLVIQQIEFCNIILLNKVSEVSEEELGRVRSIIRTIQPKATIIETDFCEIDIDRIIGTGMFDFDDVAGSAAWVQGIEDRDEHCEEDEHEHHHHHEHEDHHHHEHEHHHHEHGEHCHCHECEHNHAQEYGISTFVYQRRQPMDLGLFDEFVARHWPKGVIRAKGMVYFEEEYDMCYVFEQAGRQISMKQAGQWFATMPKEELELMLSRDEHLRQDWDEKFGDRMQKLVFIGQHMDREGIEAELDKCLVR